MDDLKEKPCMQWRWCSCKSTHDVGADLWPENVVMFLRSSWMDQIHTQIFKSRVKVEHITIQLQSTVQHSTACIKVMNTLSAICSHFIYSHSHSPLLCSHFSSNSFGSFSCSSSFPSLFPLIICQCEGCTDLVLNLHLEVLRLIWVTLIISNMFDI